MKKTLYTIIATLLTSYYMFITGCAPTVLIDPKQDGNAVAASSGAGGESTSSSSGMGGDSSTSSSSSSTGGSSSSSSSGTGGIPDYDPVISSCHHDGISACFCEGQLTKELSFKWECKPNNNPNQTPEPGDFMRCECAENGIITGVCFDIEPQEWQPKALECGPQGCCSAFYDPILPKP